MKITSRYVILAGLCAAGFLAGFSARRLSGNSPFAGRDGEAETTTGKIRTETSGDPSSKDLISAASGLRSADRHQQDIYTRWKQSNPVEAGQWLESSNLPEARKQQLRKTGKP